MQVLCPGEPPTPRRLLPWGSVGDAGQPLLLQGTVLQGPDRTLAAAAPISPSLQVQNLATVNKAETNHCSPIS